jgi:hypothetical protein
VFFTVNFFQIFDYVFNEEGDVDDPYDKERYLLREFY